MTLKLTGIHLGHVRHTADIATMRRHNIRQAGNVTLFRAAPKPKPRLAAAAAVELERAA
jgi:hypothetical protein